MNVSICIAAYNGAKFIEEQILSIINQVSGDWEIIVCDDNSNDNTVDVVKSFYNPRIKIYQNTERLGYTLNFEKAISLATKEYIFLSDQDDIWTNDKIKIMTQHLAKNDLVISNAKIINQNGEILAQSYFQLRKSKKGFIRNLIKPGFLGCTLAFKKKMLKFIMPFPKTEGKPEIAHDYWIALSGLLFFKTKWVQEPLIFYRRHENNVSNGGLIKTTNNFRTIVQLRYKVIKYLFIRKTFCIKR